MSMPPSIISASAVPYSMGLWTVASALSKVNSIWRWSKTYTNPDNIAPLAAGHLLDFVLPDSTLMRLPAVPFLIGSRLLDLFSQEDALKASYERWKDAVWFVIPVNPKAELVKKSCLNIIVSRYTITWWKTASLKAAIRTKRIVLATLNLGCETFKLIMRIMDIVELITLDPAKMSNIARQSLCEGGVHVPRCLEALGDNRYVFLDRLHDPKNVLNIAVKTLGGEPEKLQESADSLFEKLDSGLKAYKRMNETIGDATVSFVKRGLFDIAGYFIDPELVGKWFYDPSKESNFWRTVPTGGRLINKECITAQKHKDKLVDPPVYLEIITGSGKETPSPGPASSPLLNLTASSLSPSAPVGKRVFRTPKVKTQKPEAQCRKKLKFDDPVNRPFVQTV